MILALYLQHSIGTQSWYSAHPRSNPAGFQERWGSFEFNNPHVHHKVYSVIAKCCWSLSSEIWWTWGWGKQPLRKKSSHCSNGIAHFCLGRWQSKKAETLQMPAGMTVLFTLSRIYNNLQIIYLSPWWYGFKEGRWSQQSSFCSLTDIYSRCCTGCKGASTH